MTEVISLKTMPDQPSNRDMGPSELLLFPFDPEDPIFLQDCSQPMDDTSEEEIEDHIPIMAVSTFHHPWSQESQFDAFSEMDSMNYLNEPMPTLESLRQHLNSCLSCGVSWQDDHVSLDCDECGGYSLSRPCPLCEGKCGQQWKRDMACSHTLGKAKWNGSCALLTQTQKTTTDLLSCRLYGVRTTS